MLKMAQNIAKWNHYNYFTYGIFIYNHKVLYSLMMNHKKIQKNSFDQGNTSMISNYIKNPLTIDTLKDKGIQELFPVQYESYEIIYNGKDIIARDKTGSGKTLAYSLPIIQKLRETFSSQSKYQRKVRFLIIVPTRQLVRQVQQQIQSLKHHKQDFYTTALYGGDSIRQQIKSLQKKPTIIIATPGRLKDMMNKEVISFSHLSTICLDEADQMLNRGFKQDIEQILQKISKERYNKSQQRNLQFLLFSATIPKWVLQLSERYMDPNKKIINLIDQSQQRIPKSIQHKAIEMSDFSLDYLVQLIESIISEQAKGGKTIIFVQTKVKADSLGRQLQNCTILHGDVSQQCRNQNLQCFTRGIKGINILVATDVAARGLDIDNVELIIQVYPPTPQNYIHRAGRTGRAGKNGKCITLYAKHNVGAMKYIENVANIKFKRIIRPSYANPINKLQDQIQQIDSNQESNNLLNSLLKKGRWNQRQLLQKTFAFLIEKIVKRKQNIMSKLRSYINDRQYYQTYLLTFGNDITQSRVIQCVKKFFPQNFKYARVFPNGYSKKQYLLDIHENFIDQFELFINQFQEFQIRKAQTSDVLLVGFQHLQAPQLQSFRPRWKKQVDRSKRFFRYE